MKLEQFQREKDYGAALAIAGSLKKRELITPGEYRRVKAALIKKYRPVIGSLRDTAIGDTAEGKLR
jgi:hypothetical protein